MTRTLDTLDRLNHLAHKHQFDVEALDWSRPIRRDLRWAPDELAPLSHLPAYEALDDHERLRLNQLFSLGVCEQFIWLEQTVLVRTLEGVLARWAELPVAAIAHAEALKLALENFVAEERKHSEMFWRVLEKAEPSWYAERRFRLFNVSPIQAFLVDRIIANPSLFLVWIWTAIFFEERTIHYCKHFRRQGKRAPGSIDPTFLDVHEHHFLDEARHIQLDEHLLTGFYDPQPRWRRELAGRMFYGVMRAYTSPKRTAARILDILADEHPRLRARVVPELRRELPGLARNRSFHAAVFSREAAPRTFELFERYAELERLWALFPDVERLRPRSS